MEYDLFHDFSDAEKTSFPESSISKLQERWKTKCDQTDSLQVEFEQFRTSHEQINFEFEHELVELRQRCEKESKSKSEFEVKATDALDKISDLEKEVQQLNTKNATLLCQLQITKSESESVCNTSTALSGTLETKNRLIQDLKAQIAGLEEQVSGAMRAKAEAQIQSEEAASLQTQLLHKEKRLSQESSLLRGQVQLLQEQLEKRIHEALQQSNDNSSKVLHLQQDLYSATSSSKATKETQEQLERTVEDKTNRVDELLLTLKDARENELRLEESFRMELAAQKKLVSIYQTSSDDRKSQCEELERGVTELRNLLKDASQQYGALERSKEHQAKGADQEIEKREDLIHDLRDELNKVNMLLEASTKKEGQHTLFSLTPAASAASQLMSKGLTLSQLYAEYLTATDKLLKLEEENSRLTRYIDQILQEIEERAPVLRKQREEYLAATDMVTSLQQQLQDNNNSTQTLREESCEVERRCKYLMREQQRLTGHNADLSRQVTVLLTQVEAARAGLPPPQLPTEEMNTSGIVTGNDVVSAHLVCFRDVSEMQQQNQKLLHTIRELTEQAEQAEKTALDKHMQDLMAELAAAKADIEELRVSHDRVEALVENISRQRDMYKSLLQQQSLDGRKSPCTDDYSRPASAGSDMQVIDGNDPRQLQEENTKLSRDFEASKKSLSSLQDEHKQMQKKVQDTQQEANKQQEELRKNMEKTRAQNVKLLSHAEYNEERLKTLQGNCESFQRQVNGLEEKNTTLQSIVSRHEATMDHLRAEHLSLVKKLSHAEVIANNLKEEKIIFKATEARLLAEREAISRQESSQAMLLSSLQSIKNNLEHKDTSDRMRMQNQISDLSDQNTRLKAKLESNTDLKEINLKLSTAEDRLKVAERERDSSSQHMTSAREQLTVLQQRYDEAIQREKDLAIQIRDSVSQLCSTGVSESSVATSVPSKNIRDLEVQLVEERARVSTLERSLEQTKATLSGLQTTCTQQEKELKLSTEASVTSLKKLEELASEKAIIDKKLTQLEETMKAEQIRAKASIDQLTQQLEQTRDDVVSSKDVVETAKTEAEMAKRIEQEAKKKIEEAHNEVLVVQQKYEREVMLHGSDLQALAKLKEEVSSHSEIMEKLKTDKIRAEETLDEVHRAGNSLEESLKKERISLKERITELEEQNKTLLEQFTQLSDKMASIQTKMGQDGNESIGNISISEDEARTSDQLREVVKYLRRERELATGRCDLAQAEAARLKVQWESVSKHAQQLTVELTEEREHKQVSMNTASRYGELLRKVHTVDALADSNRLLRQEKDALQERSDAAKTQAESLQAQVDPLNTKLAEALAEAETLLVEKKALEKDVEMYKKRTRELVEKLNRAKPEDFLRMQHELTASKTSLVESEADCTRLRMQVGQLQKNITTMVSSRQSMSKQLITMKEEQTKFAEEVKKLSGERTRLVTQVGQQKEIVSAMQSAQQQEQLKHLEQRNQLLVQISEAKQREETARRETDQFKKEVETLKRAAESSLKRLHNVEVQKAEMQKQTVMLRKIATKYKKAAETAAEEEGTNAAAKVTELETTIANLQQQLEAASSTENRDQEDMSRTKLMEAELTRVRQELDARNKEILALRGAVNNRLEEANAKTVTYEARITHLEKENEQLSGQLETLSLKLNVQHRQIMIDSVSRQKQSSPGTSKPSTSGGSSSEKVPSESPPTANIKPLAAATPSVTMSSPRATPIPTPTSRTIPTASIRPLAPPPTPGVVMVQPRDVHSEGLVSSSTVTLPQATVTPTPATPSGTLPTTATTSTSQSNTATHTTASISASVVATLTATVSPTPVSTSMPLNQAGPSSAPVSRGVPPPVAAGTSHVSAVQGTSGSQQAGPSGAGTSSATVAILTPHDQQPQQMDVTEQAVVAIHGSADALVSQAIAMMVVPGLQEQQQQQPQAIAGPSSQKRKRDGEDESEDPDDTKRTRVEQLEGSSDSVSQGSSSGEQAQQQEHPEASDATSSLQGESSSSHRVMDASSEQQEDVILVDSDDESDGQQQQQLERRAIPGESEAEERQQAIVEDSQQDQQMELQELDDSAEAPSESHQPMHPQQQQGTAANSSSGAAGSSGQQQPSSSSAAHRQAALVLPRPSAAGSNDRVGSSGGGDSSHYDEGGDDRIVPSTPTLFAPRRGDAFPEPVSSPQRGAGARSPTGDNSSETGVSTSDASSNAAADSAAASAAATAGPVALQREGSEERTVDYPEADSMAAEVDGQEEEVEDEEEEDQDDEQGDEEEEEEDDNDDQDDQPDDDNPNDDEDDDDDIVEVADEDDEEEMREAQQHKMSEGDVSSGGEEQPGSTSYLAPSSSSSSPRRQPITWGAASRPATSRGRARGPYRSSDRILDRRQQGERVSPGEPSARRGSAFSPQRGTERGAKARRSRQH